MSERSGDCEDMESGENAERKGRHREREREVISFAEKIKLLK